MSSAPVNKQVNIYINHASAEKSMQSLQKQADKLAKSIAAGEKAGKDMTAEINKLSGIESKIATLAAQIDGRMAPSLKQVQTKVADLRRELEGMSRDAPGYAEKFEQFKNVSALFTQMKSEIRGVGSALDEMAEKPKSLLDWLKKYKDEIKTVALGTLVGGITQTLFDKATEYLGGLITGNAKLSDSVADIMKATGKTKEEVQKLNTELGKIDTRTASSELREMAVGLGQINEAASPENIQKLDTLVVALGDEFGGGAKQITTELGVLRNNLQDIKTGNYGEDVLHIGNALNVMGAEGLATAPVITSIANRLSGVAGTFKVTSGQILGIAATFQEVGIEEERGATAVNKLLLKLATDTETFAEIAQHSGISVKEFYKLVNTDIVSALVKVAEGATIAGDSNQAFGKILKDLDADGSGAGEVLSKFAKNGQLLADKIGLATNALKETNSVTDEFNIKNNTAGAHLDKLEKQFSKMISSPGLTHFLENAIEFAGQFLVVAKETVNFIDQNRIAVLLWTAAIIINTNAVKSLTGAKILERITTLASTIATNAEIIATTALSIAKAILSGNITRLRQEFLLLTATMGTNPLTALLLIAGAAAVAISQLTQKTKELTSEERVQLELASRVNDATASQIAQVEIYTRVLQNKNLSMEQQRDILNRLIALSPEYLSGLNAQNFATAEGKRMIDDYLASLKQKAEFEAELALRSELVNKRLQEQLKVDNATKKYNTLSDFDKKKYTYAVQKNSKMDLGDFFNMDEGPLKGTRQSLETIQKYNEDISTLDKKIDESVKSTAAAAAASTQNAANATSNITKNTIADIENQIKQLDEDWRKMDENDLKHITENRRQRQELEDKLTRLSGRKTPGDKSGQKDAQAALQELKALQDEIARIQAEQSKFGKDETEQKLIDATMRYAKLLEKAKGHAKELAQIEQLKENELTNIQEEGTKKQEAAAVKRHEDQLKREEENAQKEYNQRKKALQAYFDQVEADENVRFAQQLINAGNHRLKREQAEKEHEKNLQQIKQRQVNALTLNATDYQQIETAQNDLQALSLQGSQIQVEIARQTAEKIGTIWAQGFQSYFGSLSQFVQDKVKPYLDSALDIMRSVFAMQDQKDDQLLQAESKRNDQRKASYKKMLDAKRISQDQYNKLIEKSDAEYAQKEADIKKKKFEREKTASIIDATIKTAMAVLTALSSAPPPYSFILAAIAGAAGAFQIAKIASQKTPEYAKGGIVKGASHANGGIALVDSNTGEKVGEMEGDESYMILSKETTRNNRGLIDELLQSSMYGNGRKVKADYLYRPPAKLNYGKVTETIHFTRFYQNGGVTRPMADEQPSDEANSRPPSHSPDETAAVLRDLRDILATGIRAHTYWNEIDHMNQVNAELKKGSSIKS